MQEHSGLRHARGGMSLAEGLLTITVVGLLVAVAIVGFHGLDHTSSDAACDATRDAASAASDAYYSHSGTYPQTFKDLTNPASGKPLLETDAMTETATTLRGRNGWTLQLIPGVTQSDQTSFQC